MGDEDIYKRGKNAVDDLVEALKNKKLLSHDFVVSGEIAR